LVAGHIQPGEKACAHEQSAPAALVFRHFGAQFPQSRAVDCGILWSILRSHAVAVTGGVNMKANMLKTNMRMLSMRVRRETG
ncbi:hypothetical protein LLE87_37325, partial [Paenibacillus polymyxa]|nr:hypothetical protein [Paenibacillus polymyxa]